MILHLKTGDRITGKLVSEGEQSVVVDTSWAKALSIPLDQLERRETVVSTPQTNAPVASPSPATQTVPVSPAESAETGIPIKPKSPDEWKFNAKIGADMIRGERDRDIYYSQMALTYAHPYASNPKKFFRNKLEYRVDYGTTDGQESANRMYASDKTDFDFGTHAYVYNNIGGGYDEVRKIKSQIEAGPGLGYHLLTKPSFVANVEGGLAYQYQDRENSEDVEALFVRFGQDCTWKVYSKITFTQRSAILVNLDDSEQMQFRLEANLAFGIVQNLSLNLTAVELYDTRPAPGVSQNEFQLRSALGITF